MKFIIIEHDDRAKEKGTLYITVKFRDKTNTAVIPDSITWALSSNIGAIINNRTGVSVTTPAASQEISISGDDLELATNEVSKLIERVFTVEAVIDSMPHKEQSRFWVENLTAVT